MSKKVAAKPPLERVSASPETGLTGKDIDERVKKGYINKATDPNQKTPLKILFTNTFTFFNCVLFTIAAIFIIFIIFLQSIGRDDIADSYFGFSKFVFLIPAVMNVGMGTFQELQSLKVIRKLRIVTGTKSKVVRNGELQSIEAAEIVLDDIVALSAGDQATADLTVLTGEVEVDESMLTGEADHVKKTPGDTILSGSSIIVGSARCRAEKIGDETYAAELTRKVKSASGHKSELMSSIMKIIKVLTVCLCIAVAAVTVTLMIKISAYGSDASIWDGLQLSLTDPVTWSLLALTNGMFGVGIIPSGLVLTASVAMMVSIAQLTKKQTLVQELYSLENLSRVDVICLDKTGTLTDGTMTVCDVKAFFPPEEVERYMRLLMGAASDRNATSQAIFERFGEDKAASFREEIPFSSANKYSGVVMNDGKKLLMGAPEYLLPESDDRLAYVTAQANEGNRVIAVTLDGELIAFIAIEDHIRDTAADTLRFFRENGVTVKVISGDNPLTVSNIARKCGIVNAEKYISLAGVPLKDIPSVAEEYTVFARVSPEQKEALVMALQAVGHKVAMTGDGVNDILALRRSDSSITFAKATDAAKSCSDVILLDNDFSHLKEVVGEGRRVIGNIQKTAVLYLMKSLAVFLLAFALIPFPKGQMWFSVENLYMMEAAVIGTGGFLLSLEPRRTPVKGSFLKNIISQSLCAGILAVFAILIPILLNAVPKAMGHAPVIADENVRAMMTVMMSVSGIIVIFSMCIPLNKYRTLAVSAVSAVAVLLGLMLPTAYIGGQPMSGSMLAFDKAAGQTLFDSQLAREFFRPMNADVVKNLVGDVNNFIILRFFLYVAIPIFILVHFAVENYARKEFKDVKLNRAFRIGRRLMLASGVVLVLRAVMALTEIFTQSGSIGILDDSFSLIVVIITSVIFAALYLTLGIIGYELWKNPTKKMIRIAFVAAIVMAVFVLIPMILMAILSFSDSLLLNLDSYAILAAALAYVVGAIIVRKNIHLGLLKPRDK